MATQGYSQEYSFTITLKGRARDLSTEDQYDLYRFWILEHIKRCATLQYGYHPQARIQHRKPKVTLVCEQHKTGDIHYHGVITYPMEMNIKDHLMYFHQIFKVGKALYVCERYGEKRIDRTHPLYGIGKLDIKPVTDSKGWYTYLGKTFKDFFHNTGKRPILQDDHNIFGTEDILHYHA